MSHHQSIRYSWDGLPLEDADLVHIHVEPKSSGMTIHIDAPFYNDPKPQEPPKSMWELWNYEVVEIFLVGADGEYLEAEFGPHGHHLLLWLDAPRNVVQKHLPVSYQATIQKTRWNGVAHISKEHLPSPITQWNLFSIHGHDAQRKYQCMKPLGTPKPDFHQPQSFPAFPDSFKN